MQKRNVTESIRITKTLRARMDAMATEVHQKTGERPPYTMIIEVMESYTERGVIIDALADLLRPPEHQIKQALARAKRSRAS